MSDTQRMRVWWKDEFDELGPDLDDDETLLDPMGKGGIRAPGWNVPPERGIFDPDRLFHCDDVEDAARKYADYFYAERDGHENTWPVEFVVYDRQIKKFYVVSVELDHEPVFSSADPVELVHGATEPAP